MKKYLKEKHFSSRYDSWLNPGLLTASLGFYFCLAFTAHAADFRSIAAEKAIAYDAPSSAAGKLYVMSQGYPLEVIVNLSAWVKVRDQRGGLSWVASKDLDKKRMLLVTDETHIRHSGNADAKLLATVGKDVVLELLDPAIKNGWIKVKHRDGIVGYIQSSATWGLY